jgi:hypothetical protein
MINAELKPFTPPRRSFTEMDRDEIVRQTIVEIEARLRTLNVNKTYAMAFKVVIRILHAMKP